MHLLATVWDKLNAKWWRWRAVHVCWAALLSLATPGGGALWYGSQEFNQARLAGKWQAKNTWDLLAGCLGDVLGELWRLR